MVLLDRDHLRGPLLHEQIATCAPIPKVMNNVLRPLAIHLPQFHPIPENDAWWGRGFTEWTNVVKGTPRFPGHYQPHLPADMGFYDLRLTETREAQAALARAHGIHGFCYYHYWFNGKLLLERPVEGMLRDRKPDMPFMLCWANENWTRNWDGQFKDMLMEQHYGAEDDKVHIRYLFRFFEDERYIRVQGKPVFAVYRSRLLPDALVTTELWREEARAAGIGELYLLNVESFGDGQDPVKLGFDASFEFQPNFRLLGQPRRPGPLSTLLHRSGLRRSPYAEDRVYDYGRFMEAAMQLEAPAYKRFPGLTPMWDNSARRKKDAVILHGSTPELYGKWLDHVVRTFVPYSPDENFIFINAWNEWAEGNHLEPCQRWGRKYLEETARALGATLP